MQILKYMEGMLLLEFTIPLELITEVWAGDVYSCNTFLLHTAVFTKHLVNVLLKKQRRKCKNHYLIMSFPIPILSNFFVCTTECFISFQRCANLFPHSSHA